MFYLFKFLKCDFCWFYFIIKVVYVQLQSFRCQERGVWRSYSVYTLVREILVTFFRGFFQKCFYIYWGCVCIFAFLLYIYIYTIFFYEEEFRLRYGFFSVFFIQLVLIVFLCYYYAFILVFLIAVRCFIYTWNCNWIFVDVVLRCIYFLSDILKCCFLRLF